MGKSLRPFATSRPSEPLLVRSDNKEITVINGMPWKGLEWGAAITTALFNGGGCRDHALEGIVEGVSENHF